MPVRTHQICSIKIYVTLSYIAVEYGCKALSCFMWQIVETSELC